MNEGAYNEVQIWCNLYDKQYASLLKRRDFEWKINLAFWGSIATATGLLAQKICLSDKFCISIVIYLILLILYIWLLYTLWISNETDHVWMSYYRSRIENLLNDITELPVRPTNNSITYSGSRKKHLIIASLITFVFLFTSFLILYYTPIKSISS